MRLGISIVTYGRPAIFQEALAALAASTVRPDRIVVRDNSRERWTDPPASITYLWDGHNIGLPGGLAKCWQELDDVDQVLVLDDDTVLAPTTIEQMRVEMGDGVGAVSFPTLTTLELAEAGQPGVFPWSPTLLLRSAIDEVGQPLSKLFFGWDDWEYATRLRRAGYSIAWIPDRLGRQKLHRPWLGRVYLNNRNAVYLVTRRKVTESGLRRTAWMGVKAAICGRSERSKVIRRAVVHGLMGRLGPPPADLQPSETVARSHD